MLLFVDVFEFTSAANEADGVLIKNPRIFLVNLMGLKCSRGFSGVH